MYEELLGHKINVGNSTRMSASLLLPLSFGDDTYPHSGCFLLKCPGIELTGWRIVVEETWIESSLFISQQLLLMLHYNIAWDGLQILDKIQWLTLCTQKSQKSKPFTAELTYASISTTTSS
jgi:hypothetical protein